MYLTLHPSLVGGIWCQSQYMPTPGGGVSSTRTLCSQDGGRDRSFTRCRVWTGKSSSSPRWGDLLTVSYILGIKVSILRDHSPQDTDSLHYHCCIPPTIVKLLCNVTQRPSRFAALDGLYYLIECRNFPCGSDSKESTCNAGDLGSIAGLGRSPGEGNGYPFQYSGLDNFMDYIIHRITKSWTWLRDFNFSSTTAKPNH